MSAPNVSATGSAQRWMNAQGRRKRRADAARVAWPLRELERQGQVTAQGPGQWRVPPNLLEQLEQRHWAAPRLPRASGRHGASRAASLA
jgi:hypothetical protein